MAVRKRGVIFKICFRKRGYPERGLTSGKGGGGGSNPGRNYVRQAFGRKFRNNKMVGKYLTS